MKKNYSVIIRAYSTVVVEGASSPQEAMELAEENVRFGDFEHDESEVEMELKTKEELDSAKRHANSVVEDE